MFERAKILWSNKTIKIVLAIVLGVATGIVICLIVKSQGVNLRTFAMWAAPSFLVAAVLWQWRFGSAKDK